MPILITLELYYLEVSVVEVTALCNDSYLAASLVENTEFGRKGYSGRRYFLGRRSLFCRFTMCGNISIAPSDPFPKVQRSLHFRKPEWRLQVTFPPCGRWYANNI